MLVLAFSRFTNDFASKPSPISQDAQRLVGQPASRVSFVHPCGIYLYPLRTPSFRSHSGKRIAALQTRGLLHSRRHCVPNIRIVVASKYPIVRTALATLLKTILGFEVVAETDLSQLSKVAKKMP